MTKAVTPRMRDMLVESRPDDITGRSGTGVELWTGADYAVARALQRRELGHVEGPGQAKGLPGMYWSNSDGLSERAELMPVTESIPPDEDFDDYYEGADIGCVNCDGGWRHGCCDDMCIGSNEPEWCDRARPCPVCNPTGEIL